jgi:hypothetical protein
MVSANVLPSVRLDGPPDFLVDVLSDAAIKAVYFSLVAISFVFAAILLTGIHP